MIIASKGLQEYFESLQRETKRAYEVASRARATGYDPSLAVEVPLAVDMAERVTGLISSVMPQLANPLLTKRIKELEQEYELLDWRVALRIGEEVARGKFCKFNNREEAIEAAIRVGFAYLTLGIVAAPLEGFVGSKIKKRRDGKEYLALYYAGPIRGAGGTAAATSVILADYIRICVGLDVYDPNEDEINRYISEIHDYHDAKNLQYFPSDDEIKFLIRNVAVEITGEPTEQKEVSNYKDLARIETNRLRGGACLVLAEGIAQKAPKLWKRLSTWAKDFGLKWSFLEEFIGLQKIMKAKLQVGAADVASAEKTSNGGAEGGSVGVVDAGLTPNYTYISDIVAGRPVLGHPLREGGFRLRYGRTRVSGFSAASIHPVTMALLNRYVAIGTQLKVERPGKAAAITPCDSIEGSIVKLKNGSVVKLWGASDVKSLIGEVAEIIYLGDILVSYGDFYESGHKLIPVGYCEEWWVQEVEKATVNLFGTLDVDKLADFVEVSKDFVEELLKNPNETSVSFEQSKLFSDRLKVPLHPRFTYFWRCIDYKDLIVLLGWLGEARIETNERGIEKIVLPCSTASQQAKRALEVLGVEHNVVNNEFVVISKDDAKCIDACLSMGSLSEVKSRVESLVSENPGENKSGSNLGVLNIINLITPFVIRDKAGTFIGARMGRPEKAKMRRMEGQPHILFPVGREGDRLRSFQSAMQKGKVYSEFPVFYCKSCKAKTIYGVCEKCNSLADKIYSCVECGESEQQKCKHGDKVSFKKQALDVKFYFDNAVSKLGFSTYPDLIKGVRGTSNKNHVVEHIAKGILRAKHSVYVNKDGTIRYDMTELPITHFKPKEIGTSVEKLKELGYNKDVFGRELVGAEQIAELKPQDVILPSNENSLDESAKKVLFRVSKFIDELIVRLYGLPAYYNLEKEEDLVGHLVVGLAPHISAGMVGRIVGFSDTQGCFAHPLWHAGLRRDCDGDECCVSLLLDVLINFSREYLPDQRGAKTMDSPLVLTSLLIPSEVDDQSHGLDVVWRYPLQLYESALEYKNPWEVKVDQIKHRLNTERQYENFGYTHNLSNINLGVKCSAYKTIPTMEEKLRGQVELAVKIRAVDAEDVVRLVIEKHFLKDIKGNLRQFSMQKFRCSSCNEKFRRPPLIGKCLVCGGNLLFTVSEGSIIKYLEPSIKLAKEFNLPSYLVQSIEVTKRRVEGLFGKEKEKQSGLQVWVS